MPNLPLGKAPRQLTGKETLERMAKMTAEEWEPFRLQLIVEEEAQAARTRASMNGGKKAFPKASVQRCLYQSDPASPPSPHNAA